MEAALLEGVTLIVDRYSYSGVAFSAAKGLDVEWCKVIHYPTVTPQSPKSHSIITPGLPLSHYTVILQQLHCYPVPPPIPLRSLSGCSQVTHRFLLGYSSFALRSIFYIEVICTGVASAQCCILNFSISAQSLFTHQPLVQSHSDQGLFYLSGLVIDICLSRNGEVLSTLCDAYFRLCRI